MLGVSILGNWEQFKELDFRSNHIDELKLEIDELTRTHEVDVAQFDELQENCTSLEEQLYDKTDAMKKLEGELDASRKEKESIQADIAGLQKQLLKSELSEEQRQQLEKDLVRANTKLDQKDEMLVRKDDLYNKLASDFGSTQTKLSDLNMQVCGAFTPRGLANVVDSSFSTAPGATSIAGYLVLSYILSLFWGMLYRWMWRGFSAPLALDNNSRTCADNARGVGVRSIALQNGKGGGQAGPAFHERWFVWCIAKAVALAVLLLAITRLPMLLRNFAGDKAMRAAEATKSSACFGFSWCEATFDYAVIPWAIITAEGETYVHLIRGTNQFWIAYSLAVTAEQSVVLAVRFAVAATTLTCAVLGGRLRIAFPGMERPRPIAEEDAELFGEQMDPGHEQPPVEALGDEEGEEGEEGEDGDNAAEDGDEAEPANHYL